MADQDFTPEPRSAKGNYPHRLSHSAPHSSAKRFPRTRELTILETLINPTGSPTPHIGVSYTPVHLEPCVLLKGKWLREAGFAIGQKVTVTVNRNELVITPVDAVTEGG